MDIIQDEYVQTEHRKLCIDYPLVLSVGKKSNGDIDISKWT